MYSAANMLSKARSNPIYGKIRDNNKSFYRNVYLNSDHWKNLRREKLEQNPKCENCGTSKCLDVHHIEYRELFDVSVKDLQTLCRICHNKEHEKKKVKEEKIKHKKLNRKWKLPKHCFDYDQLWYIFNCPNPNFILIKWILNYIINNLKEDLKPRYLSKYNRIKQERFDKKYKEIPRELNNYISIHY